ncbi:transporter [Pseudoxanthomonas kalamensis DSM 18571]|uniref:RDD family protein n=1 Tax=Pseudoxanthomonas kalamensis TaxID=289483 RepID=UPI001391F15E|nr:RDD family protein [Pseudoxanthomonas kalamensis]KAF1712107.1 transporter [Pseudoxanthomonas kalamensis DSM 18571]
MSIWFYADADRQRQGPLATDELKRRFHAGDIGPDTLVWRDGMLQWRPLADLMAQLGMTPPPAAVESPSPLAPAAPPSLPPEPEPELSTPVADAPASGRAVFALGSDPVEPAPARDYVPSSYTPVSDNPYAPARSPLTGQLPARMAAADENVVYAGFWKRVAASIIDSLIVGIAGGLTAEALGGIFGDLSGSGALGTYVGTLLLTLCINVFYYAGFHSGFVYATPGKMAVGIKVARSDGEPIGFLRGVARYFALFLSSLILCIGYLMAAFTARKQALHDMICDTVVVDKWAFTGQPGMQRRELGAVTTVVLVLGALMLVAWMVIVMAIALPAYQDYVRRVRAQQHSLQAVPAPAGHVADTRLFHIDTGNLA